MIIFSSSLLLPFRPLLAPCLSSTRPKPMRWESRLHIFKLEWHKNVLDFFGHKIHIKTLQIDTKPRQRRQVHLKGSAVSTSVFMNFPTRIRWGKRNSWWLESLLSRLWFQCRKSNHFFWTDHNEVCKSDWSVSLLYYSFLSVPRVPARLPSTRPMPMRWESRQHSFKLEWHQNV